MARSRSRGEVIADAKFPGLAGTAEGSPDSFEMNDEWYSLKNFAPDLHVILIQDHAGNEWEGLPTAAVPRDGLGPTTWQGARVLHFYVGHREDVWSNPKFQQIVLGGLGWAFGNVRSRRARLISNKSRPARACLVPPA